MTRITPTCNSILTLKWTLIIGKSKQSFLPLQIVGKEWHHLANFYVAFQHSEICACQITLLSLLLRLHIYISGVSAIGRLVSPVEIHSRLFCNKRNILRNDDMNIYICQASENSVYNYIVNRPGAILFMSSANGRRRYNVTSALIG